MIFNRLDNSHRANTKVSILPLTFHAEHFAYCEQRVKHKRFSFSVSTNRGQSRTDGSYFAFRLSSAVRSSTRSVMVLPDLNFTVARAGIVTSISGFLGFRPGRDFERRTSKTPKFRSSTVRPSASASVMASRVSWTMAKTSAWIIPESLLICWTISRLVRLGIALIVVVAAHAALSERHFLVRPSPESPASKPSTPPAAGQLSRHE